MMNVQTAARDFLLHCRLEKNLSPKTLKAYGTDLRQAAAFLDPQRVVTDVTKHDIRDFLASLSHLQPKSVKRKVAVMKALFNHLEFEDKIPVNPFRKMRIKIKEPRRLPVVMDMPDILKIFKVCYREKNEVKDTDSYAYREAIRNICVVELLFATGARVSEIAGLKKECINLRTGVIVIKGKGNKERVIQICNKETMAVLEEYYALFANQISASGGWFLINRFKKPLSDQSIRNMVKTIARQSKIPMQITPHIFRHSFATLLLEKDVDIKYIQSLLGHSSINTTQIYTHVNRKRQRQLLKAKHPRRDFSMVA